jgi:excisionase family DNA binding protein
MNPAVARIAARWFTFEEAKAALKVGDDVLRRLLLAGEIYGKKVGKEWRVDLESIEEFLDSGRSKAKVALARLRK